MAVRQVELLKKLTVYHVVDNPLLSTQQQGQRRIIRELYRCFRGALKKRNTNIFPARFRDDAQAVVGQSLEEQGRLVADVVASMTEVQAVQTHRRLLGYDFGSLVDPALL